MTSPVPSKAAPDKENAKQSNFLRQIIEKDLAEGTYAEVSTNAQVMEAYMGTSAGALEGAH